MTHAFITFLTSCVPCRPWGGHFLHRVRPCWLCSLPFVFCHVGARAKQAARAGIVSCRSRARWPSRAWALPSGWPSSSSAGACARAPRATRHCLFACCELCLAASLILPSHRRPARISASSSHLVLHKALSRNMRLQARRCCRGAVAAASAGMNSRNTYIGVRFLLGASVPTSSHGWHVNDAVIGA